MTPRPGLLLVAEIGKPHGLAGEVYVLRVSDDPGRLEPGSQLVRDDGSTLTVAAVRPHRHRLLVRFDGVDDRSAAEGLRGPLYADPATAQPLDDGRYWTRDIEGCDVHTRSGEAVGRVTAVVPGPAQDLLAVDTAAGERLVPFVEAIVVEVDLAGRRVIIDPPEGLLD